jgi:hypothetical protein
MTYQEMLDQLAAMEEQRRQATIAEHWQAVLGDGFVAFVQGQIEAARNWITPSTGYFENVFEGQSEELKRLMMQQLLKRMAAYVSVWDSMQLVYRRLQQHSERQGPAGGMVDHGRHDRMPRGVHVAPAARCYRCGSPAEAGGLCGGCRSTETDWAQADAEYDREQYRRQMDDLDYRRLQDDYLYQSTQPDFNSYDPY